MAIEVMHFDRYIGFYDPKAKKRLTNVYPNTPANIPVRRKATAFEGGYNTIYVDDLHKRFMGKRTVSQEEYRRTLKRFRTQ